MRPLAAVGAGVKVAVQTSGLTLLWTRPLRSPPLTATSESVKSVTGSLKVKVMVVLLFEDTLVLPALRATVGGTVSSTPGRTAKLTLLLASEPSALRLPAASLKVLLATMTAPLLTPAAGVKVAL